GSRHPSVSLINRTSIQQSDGEGKLLGVLGGENDRVVLGDKPAPAGNHSRIDHRRNQPPRLLVVGGALHDGCRRADHSYAVLGEGHEVGLDALLAGRPAEFSRPDILRPNQRITAPPSELRNEPGLLAIPDKISRLGGDAVVGEVCTADGLGIDRWKWPSVARLGRQGLLDDRRRRACHSDDWKAYLGIGGMRLSFAHDQHTDVLSDVQENAIPTGNRTDRQNFAARPDETSHAVVERAGAKARGNDEGNDTARLRMPKAKLCEERVLVDVAAVGYTSPCPSAHLLD